MSDIMLLSFREQRLILEELTAAILAFNNADGTSQMLDKILSLHDELQPGAPLTVTSVDRRIFQPEYALFITSFGRFISVAAACLHTLAGTGESMVTSAWFHSLWGILLQATGTFTEWAAVLQLESSVYWGPSPSEPALLAALNDLHTSYFTKRQLDVAFLMP